MQTIVHSYSFRARSLPILLLCAVVSANSAAQNRASDPRYKSGWQFSIGGGTIVTPLYLGDDQYGVNIAPDIRVQNGERFSASVQDGAKLQLVKRGNFRLGALAAIEFGRNQDGSGPFRIAGGETSDLIGLGDIETSPALGGFAEIETGKIRASARVQRALSGHEGLTGRASVRYGNKVRFAGPPIIYRFGGDLDFSNDPHADAFFGVNAAQSAQSGLPSFRAKGGVVSYGASATTILPLSRSSAVTAIASYKRMTGSTADAPLVSLRGSPDQFFAGLILSREFK